MSRSELADAVNAALDLLYPDRSLSALYVNIGGLAQSAVPPCDTS
jgi:hypothetical protein